MISEYGPYVRNKILYAVEITQSPEEEKTNNRLVIYVRGVYDTEGKIVRHQIERDSALYKEAEKMAFTIKNLAEKM